MFQMVISLGSLFQGKFTFANNTVRDLPPNNLGAKGKTEKG